MHLRLNVLLRSAHWTFRYTSQADGRRHDLGLGGYPRVSVQTAREKAEVLRSGLFLGLDPLVVRRQNIQEQRNALEARTRAGSRDKATLERVARSYHATRAPTFRNPKHAAQWLASLENYVFPKFGRRPVASITPVEIHDLIAEIGQTVPETARRIRQRLDAVFEDCVLRELADRNPAAAVKRQLQEGRARTAERHHAALPYLEVPAFLIALRDFERVSIAARLALEFTVLTAARTGETLGATWDEVDLRAREWRIAGARMKSLKPHRVPLTDATMRILRAAEVLRDGRYVFPTPMGHDKPLSNMSLLMCLRRLGYGDKTTVHGFRGAFSSWARENTKLRVDTIEAALAHRDEDKVVRAYAHAADYWTERRQLAEQWAAFCTTAPKAAAKVLRLRR